MGKMFLEKKDGQRFHRFTSKLQIKHNHAIGLHPCVHHLHVLVMFWSPNDFM